MREEELVRKTCIDRAVQRGVASCDSAERRRIAHERATERALRGDKSDGSADESEPYSPLEDTGGIPTLIVPFDIPKVEFNSDPSHPVLFSAAFECGNLASAKMTNFSTNVRNAYSEREPSRDTAKPEPTAASSGYGPRDPSPNLARESSPQHPAEDLPFFQYDLEMDSDTHTEGHTQWFYFAVKAIPKCRVRFNITNFRKGKSAHSFGLQPHVLRIGSVFFPQWDPFACQNVTYTQSTKKQKNGDPYFVFSYTFDFSHDGEQVFFSLFQPYTYSMLIDFVHKLERHPLSRRFVSRGIMSRRSISGAPVPRLLISNGIHVSIPSTGSAAGLINGAPKTIPLWQKKPAIVIIARQHPGEVQGSWMASGMIRFLVGPTGHANALRDRFCFHVIPQVNVDGVLFGNSRCTLAGVDPNRRWHDPNPILHPIVHCVKEYIMDLSKTGDIVMFLDLHGHAIRPYAFFYGCNPSDPRNALLPKIASMLSSDVSFESSRWKFGRAHNKTARVVAHTQAGVPNSFTIEASFYGATAGTESGYEHHCFTGPRVETIGVAVCRAMVTFFNLPMRILVQDSPGIRNAASAATLTEGTQDSSDAGGAVRPQNTEDGQGGANDGLGLLGARDSSVVVEPSGASTIKTATSGRAETEESEDIDHMDLLYREFDMFDGQEGELPWLNYGVLDGLSVGMVLDDLLNETKQGQLDLNAVKNDGASESSQSGDESKGGRKGSRAGKRNKSADRSASRQRTRDSVASASSKPNHTPRGSQRSPRTSITPNALPSAIVPTTVSCPAPPMPPTPPSPRVRQTSIEFGKNSPGGTRRGSALSNAGSNAIERGSLKKRASREDHSASSASEPTGSISVINGGGLSIGNPLQQRLSGGKPPIPPPAESTNYQNAASTLLNSSMNSSGPINLNDSITIKSAGTHNYGRADSSTPPGTHHRQAAMTVKSMLPGRRSTSGERNSGPRDSIGSTGSRPSVTGSDRGSTSFGSFMACRGTNNANPTSNLAGMGGSRRISLDPPSGDLLATGGFSTPRRDSETARHTPPHLHSSDPGARMDAALKKLPSLAPRSSNSRTPPMGQRRSSGGGAHPVSTSPTDGSGRPPLVPRPPQGSRPSKTDGPRSPAAKVVSQFRRQLSAGPGSERVMQSDLINQRNPRSSRSKASGSLPLAPKRASEGAYPRYGSTQPHPY